MNSEYHIIEKPADLPSVQRLLERDEAGLIVAQWGHAQCVTEIRQGLERLRSELRAQTNGAIRFSPSAFLGEISATLAANARPGLRRVINATGIPIHTNLGRVPLAAEALAAINEAAAYTTLEYNLDTGERGAREGKAAALLVELSGAEAALVVNNNAAAVVLALNTLALGRGVLVSRGELAEIGGSFRIADIVTRSGARLVEVGATNKTRRQDYAAAIGSESAVLLRVHPSNFRIEGFHEETAREEVVALTREKNLVAMEDLGSGALFDLGQLGLPAEPTVRDVLADGMDVVTFSGDKLLGGPQAGIIVGRYTLLEQMRNNPLYRALRPDKLCIAALEATLRLYQDPARIKDRLPLLRLMSTPMGVLRERAERVRLALPAARRERVIVREDVGYAGGGALPREAVATIVLAVDPAPMTVDSAAKALRENAPPIIARRAKGRLFLDLRTVMPGEIESVALALRRIVSRGNGQ